MSRSPSVLSATSAAAARTSDQIQSDLGYLRDHRVCERLEGMVKALLREQPEDPVLFICRMLRESGRAGSIIRASANGGTPHSKLSDRVPAPSALTANSMDDKISGAATNNDSPMSDGVAASPQSYAAPSPATDVAGGNSAATPNASGGVGTDLAAGSSNSLIPYLGLPPLNGHGNSTSQSNQPNPQQKPPSLQSSRVGTPSANQQGGARKGIDVAGTMPRSALERDESSKSETSCFSISSVDMSEFLSEFRSAHYTTFGENRRHISKLDLADIVDRVNLPVPDVRMLVDLFQELVDDTTGTVRFEAFLSRMNYKIQGRYPTELVKGVYYSVFSIGIEGTNSALPRGYPESLSGRTTPTPHLARATSSNSVKSLTSIGGAAPVVSGAASQPAAPVMGLAKKACLEDGFWEGLGIRVTNAEFNKAASQLGIPTDDGFMYLVTDFVRLVNYVTGQSKEDE